MSVLRHAASSTTNQRRPSLGTRKVWHIVAICVVGIQTRSKPMKQWPNHIKTFASYNSSSPSSIIPQAGTPSPSGVRPCPRSLTLELWSPIRPYHPAKPQAPLGSPRALNPQYQKHCRPGSCASPTLLASCSSITGFQSKLMVKMNSRYLKLLFPHRSLH